VLLNDVPAVPAAIPKRDYWNGVLYMLGLLHVSGTIHLWY
jgi:hypothetical protein